MGRQASLALRPPPRGPGIPLPALAPVLLRVRLVPRQSRLALTAILVAPDSAPGTVVGSALETLPTAPQWLRASLRRDALLLLNATAACVKVVACIALAWSIAMLTVLRTLVPQSITRVVCHRLHLPLTLAQDAPGALNVRLVSLRPPTTTGISLMVALPLLLALHPMRPPLRLPPRPRETRLRPKTRQRVGLRYPSRIYPNFVFVSPVSSVFRLFSFVLFSFSLYSVSFVFAFFDSYRLWRQRQFH